MPSSFSLRWFAVSVFVVSSSLNYLDRQLLVTLAPLIMQEFHLNQTAFGALISAFSIAYAASTLGTGWLLDRFGVNRAITAAVGWWSLAAAATGLVRSLGGLTICRAALGVGESPSVAAVGKLNGLYLKPEERALGAAVNGIGLSVGAAIAPLWIGVATVRGWRLPMVITGLCGLAWIPVWLLVSRAIPPRYGPTELASPAERERLPLFAVLKERNLQILAAANVLWMGSYSLWFSWTTLYLMHVHNLTLSATAKYVWIPPLVSNAGGFFGGWLSLRWMKKAVEAVKARRRAVWVSAVGALVALLLPLAHDAAWATALISASFFFALAGSVNIYALPIDLYGAQRSGMAIAALTFAFGILQTVISPIIGYLYHHQLYTPVLWLVTIPLLLSAALLGGLRSEHPAKT